MPKKSGSKPSVPKKAARTRNTVVKYIPYTAADTQTFPQIQVPKQQPSPKDHTTTGSATTKQDPEKPSSDTPDGNTSKQEKTNAENRVKNWSLANLILMIAGIVVLLIAIVWFINDVTGRSPLTKYSDTEGVSMKIRDTVYISSTAAIAFLSAIFFFITEDIRHPLVIFDKETPIFVILLIIEMVFTICAGGICKCEKKSSYTVQDMGFKDE